tara:strand:+ start:528 stop:704 length:177 start_codon:yes stop_codon:yes gene_type:complete
MDASEVLAIVVDYIRGEINLENATKKLQIIGLNKKKIKKILKDTPRDNIIKINYNKKM